MASLLIKKVNLKNKHFKWDRFSDEIINEFQDLYADEYFHDCTLWADGTSRECHRIVLSSHSPFFKSLLEEHVNDRPIISLDGVSKDELNAIVEFLYTGSTIVTTNFIEPFLETCKNLQISGLLDYALSAGLEDNILNDKEEPIEVLEDVLSAGPIEVLENDWKADSIEVLEDVLSTDYETIYDENVNFVDVNQLEEDEGSHRFREGETTDNNLEYSSPFSVVIEVLKEGEKNNAMESPKNNLSMLPVKKYCSNNVESVTVKENMKGSEFACPKCGKLYSHRRTLLHHLHWICNQPATYACNLCPYMGKRKFQLKSHMSHAHKKVLTNF